MIQVAFDTSTKKAYFSVEKDNQIIIDECWQINNGASDILITLANCLKINNIEFSDINTWLVGIGPGSFTGLRVSIAFVQGLCYNNKIRLFGINSAYLFMPFAETNALILHDGRQQKILINSFIYKNKWQQIQQPYVLDIKDIDPLLKKFDIIKTSMSIKSFKNSGSYNLKKIKFFIPTTCSHFFSNKLQRYSPNSQSVLEPIYVRPAVFTPPLT